MSPDRALTPRVFADVRSSKTGGGSMGLADWRKKMMGEANRLINQLGAPIAIDFGASSLKLLQITGTEVPALVAAAAIPTPEDLLGDKAKRLAFQLEALPKLIRSAAFKGRRAVCSIPASHAYCKHMQFQAEPGANVGALVRSGVASQLGCDPSALVFRHIEVGQVGRGNKTEVICMAAARELVERLMRVMKDAKLEPVGMHLEYTASLRAFDSITRRVEDDALTSLYLDIGAGATKVSIAHGRNLVFARSIDLGGRHLDQTVARQLKLVPSDARAHRLKMSELVRKDVPSAAPLGAGMAVLAAVMRRDGAAEGQVAGTTAVLDERRQGLPARGHTADLTRQPAMAFSPPQADLAEPLEILTDEVSMSLRYHESIFPDRRIDRAIFIGGEARHLGLCQHIARTLRLPAQVADPMAGVARAGDEPTVGVDFSQPQPGWATALGLCLSPTDL